MALNFSHRPIFPSHLSEDNLVSPMRIGNGCFVEGIPERSGDGFVRPWYLNREIDDGFNYGRERGDRSGSPEMSKDILELLPSDPFGMDISTTFTALTGWLEDLEVDYGGYAMIDGRNNRGDYDLFAGLNFIWNKAVQFQSFPSNVQLGDKSDSIRQVGGFGSVPVVQDAVSFVNETPSAVGQQIQKLKEVAGSFSDGANGFPHQALSFALSFLGVRDLLSAEQACKSLHSTIRSDTLLWKSIHIDQPLNEKISDDVLLQLTNRAHGHLRCLSLVECPRITDDGLNHVLENNPRLTKLCVPGCTRLSIEGVVNNLKAFNSINKPGIKQLRIGGLYGIMDEHFEDLKLLLGVDDHIPHNDHQPHFYHKGNLYLTCDDDRAIDIEKCPKCQKLRLVYDCPSESCQEKGDNLQACRACRLCIPRCFQCGGCINDSEYEETFCLEWLCSDCSKQIMKSPDGQVGGGGLPEDGVLQEAIYNSYVHG